MTVPPILVVHGLWDTPVRISPLVDGLKARGFATVHAMALSPNDGRASLTELAKQVAHEADALAHDTKVDAIDLIGFSMGALVSRACLLLERASMTTKVRRFVSISGPHAGARNAFVLPASRFPGIADMRPHSAFLRTLEGKGSITETEVHCFYTPFDLMVTPAKSAILTGAASVQMVPVPLHRFMVRDARVIDRVAEILRRV